MVFGSDRSANFVIKAKDAATGPLGKVGGAMGKLKGIASSAFAGIAAAAAVAAAAITAFVADSVKGAIDDERSQILTTAALKARGFELDKLGPKMAEQIKALQRFGKSDDDVRAGLEVGSRYFKHQNNLLKANAAAAAISSVTGEDMASVMGKIGKAANGSTRGLAALIGPIEKGATVTDILTQANDKFLDTANALADSTSGKMLTAQQQFNEAMDKFGTQFLPVVQKVITWFVEQGLPAFQKVLDDVGPIIQDIVDNYVGPLLDSVGELFALFDNSDFSVFDAALWLIKGTLDAVKIVIDAIVAGIKFIQGNPVQAAAYKAASNNAAASTTFGLGTTTGGGSYGVGTPGGYTSGYGLTQVQVTIGNKAQSDLSYKLGLTSNATNANRTSGNFHP